MEMKSLNSIVQITRMKRVRNEEVGRRVFVRRDMRDWVERKLSNLFSHWRKGYDLEDLRVRLEGWNR